MDDRIKGLSRQYLDYAARLREQGRPFTVETVSEVLQLSPKKAEIVLRWLHQAGWIKRLKQKVYLSSDLFSSDVTGSIFEAFVIADTLFAPCYIGGWSAVVHWDLTDQIFNETFVLTQAPQKQQALEILGHKFRVKKCASHHFFGLKSLWINALKVKISDPSKTIIDLLSSPEKYGGIVPIREAFKEYLRSKHCHLETLLTYAKQQQNTAVIKRVGFLMDQEKAEERAFINACLAHLGNSRNTKLDSGFTTTKWLKKWQLWVPEQDVSHDQ